jgi:hypothetical protein
MKTPESKVRSLCKRVHNKGLSRSKKDEFIFVNDPFESKHNADVGLYKQTFYCFRFFSK